MKFQRYDRYEPITITQRKIAAFARKQAAERARYPLFPSHVANEQKSVEAEMAARHSNWESTETRMRAHFARSWRTSRARYFSLPVEVRREILAKWDSWVGPRTPSYFGWMVDTLSGDQEKRWAVFQASCAEIRARLSVNSVRATGQLFAFDVV